MSEEGTLVFRESVDRKAIVRFAVRLGWAPAGDVERGHSVLASERFTSSDGTTIEYLEDHTGDVRFVQVSGPSIHTITSILRESFPYYEAGELLDSIPDAEDPVDWIRGLSRLSVYRPELTHPKYLALWSRALNHSDVAVRRAAIRTSYGCRWPELLPLVKGRIAIEPALGSPLEALARHLQNLAAVGAKPGATKRPSA